MIIVKIFQQYKRSAKGLVKKLSKIPPFRNNGHQYLVNTPPAFILCLKIQRRDKVKERYGDENRNTSCTLFLIFKSTKFSLSFS